MSLTQVDNTATEAFSIKIICFIYLRLSEGTTEVGVSHGEGLVYEKGIMGNYEHDPGTTVRTERAVFGSGMAILGKSHHPNNYRLAPFGFIIPHES